MSQGGDEKGTLCLKSKWRSVLASHCQPEGSAKKVRNADGRLGASQEDECGRTKNLILH